MATSCLQEAHPACIVVQDALPACLAVHCMQMCTCLSGRTASQAPGFACYLTCGLISVSISTTQAVFGTLLMVRYFGVTLYCPGFNSVPSSFTDTNFMSSRPATARSALESASRNVRLNPTRYAQQDICRLKELAIKTGRPM